MRATDIVIALEILKEIGVDVQWMKPDGSRYACEYKGLRFELAGCVVRMEQPERLRKMLDHMAQRRHARWS